VDPNLPAGYAPLGIQVIGSQVFVTYAVQDAAKHDLIAGRGNGIVSIFDTNGGSAPAAGCFAFTDVGKQTLVPYIADYSFFRKDN